MTRWFSTLALAGGLLVGQEDGSSHYQRGMEAYNRRDHAAAVRELSAFLADPGGTEAQRREATAALGLSFHFLGDDSRATPLLERASESAPDNSEFAYALGLSHLRRNNAMGARRAFARLFGVPRDSAQAHLLTARFMIREELEPMAQEELERAAELQPDLPQLHFLLGQLAIARGEHDRAIGELQREIELNPGFGMAYYRLGDALTRKGLWNEAIAPLQKAIWLNPEFSSPYVLLGKVYDQTGQTAVAEAMLKRALAMDPNNAATRYLLGTVLRKAGREEEAREQFDAYRRLRK